MTLRDGGKGRISLMQQENNLPFLPKYPKQTAEEPVLKDKNIV